MPERKETLGVKSVSKALYLLSFFTEAHPEWGIRELSAESGINPSSVYKLLTPFYEMEFLEQDVLTKQYKLGVQFIRYANIVQEKLDVIKVAQPFIEKIAETEHGTVNISLYIGDHVFHKLEASYDIGLQVVTRHVESDCLHRTANGRMILSTWDKEAVLRYIREHDTPADGWSKYPHEKDIDAFWEDLQRFKQQGFSIASSFQFFPEVVAVAVPIIDQTGRQVAGLSYYEVIPTSNQERIQHLAGLLKQAVADIEYRMGWR